MKRIFWKLVLVASLVAGGSGAKAEVAPNPALPSGEVRPGHPVLTPVQRKALWERMQARLAVLREKKANGTLNLRQEQALERLEKREALIIKRRQERAKQRWAPTASPS